MFQRYMPLEILRSYGNNILKRVQEIHSQPQKFQLTSTLGFNLNA
jgi:hypothetical protein